MKFSIICIIILILIFFTVSVEAFRCKNEPIGRWDTKGKVLKYCGQPVKTGSKKVFYKDQDIYAETYFYNCGEGDFIYAVSFYDNIVIREEPITRGYGVGQCK